MKLGVEGENNVKLMDECVSRVCTTTKHPKKQKIRLEMLIIIIIITGRNLK